MASYPQTERNKNHREGDNSICTSVPTAARGIWTRVLDPVSISYYQPLDRFVVHEGPSPPPLPDVSRRVRELAPFYARFLNFAHLNPENFRIDPFVELCVETTTKCNLRCNVCISDSGPQAKEFLALSDLKRTLANKTLPLRLTLTGGEFFARTDWKAMTDYLFDLGIGIVVSTNGTLLTERTLKYFSNSPTVFALSLDGLEETHDMLRRQAGNFQTVWKSLRRLEDAGIPVHVYSVLQETNKAELLPLSHELSQLNIVEHRIMNVINRGRGGDLGIPPPPAIKDELEKLNLPHVVTVKSRQHPFPLLRASGHLQWLNSPGQAEELNQVNLSQLIRGG
jgi:organic radical activating enzyme